MKIDHNIRKALEGAISKIGNPYQLGIRIGVSHTTVARWLDGSTANIEGDAWEKLYPLLLPHLREKVVSISMIPGFAGEVQEFIDVFCELNLLQRKQVLSILKEYQGINHADVGLPGKGGVTLWVVGAAFETRNDACIEEFIRLLVRHLKITVVKKEVVVSKELICRIWVLGSGSLDDRMVKKIESAATLSGLELKYSREMKQEDLKREKVVRKSLLGRAIDKVIPDKILSFENYMQIKEHSPKITEKELLKEISKTV